MIAELVALRYHRALDDGTGDSLTAEVTARTLSDKQRHGSFHCEQLHASLAQLPRAMRRPVMAVRRLLMFAVSLVVAADHVPALRRLGTGRLRTRAPSLGITGASIMSAQVSRLWW